MQSNRQQESTMRIFAISIAAALSALVSGPAWCDPAAAEALARKSGCLKCHGISKDKEGPSLQKTAAKYKGKADAIQKLTTHLTTSPKVKIEGKEEDHEQLKTKNPAEIRDVIDWILSQ